MKWFKWFGKDYSAEAMKRNSQVAQLRGLERYISDRAKDGMFNAVVRGYYDQKVLDLLEHERYLLVKDVDGSIEISWK